MLATDSPEMGGEFGVGVVVVALEAVASAKGAADVLLVPTRS